MSDDPDHFELLDGELAKDGGAVYWSDGSVLSDDPAIFAIVSNKDHYLFTRDSRTVHVNGNPIEGAEPATFRVLQGGYARDSQRAYYFTDQIADADLTSLSPLEGMEDVASDDLCAHRPWAGVSGRAYTTILLLVTLLALISLGRIRGRAALRCAAPADTRYVLEK